MDSHDTYLVTGATGGIGRAIVAALASEGGHRIVMAVRNTEQAMDYASTLVDNDCLFDTLALDLGDLRSVDVMCGEFRRRGWRLKGLINNAGVMPRKVQFTIDGYERAVQVNYLATRRLTERLLPMMDDGGVIVFTTSVTRKLARYHDDWAVEAIKPRVGRRFFTYGLSKLLVTRYAHELSQKLAPRDIRVNCADPGVVDTGMIKMGNRMVDWLADKLFRPVIYTPREGAMAAMRALRSPHTDYIFTPRGMNPMK